MTALVGMGGCRKPSVYFALGQYFIACPGHARNQRQEWGTTLELGLGGEDIVERRLGYDLCFAEVLLHVVMKEF